MQVFRNFSYNGCAASNYYSILFRMHSYSRRHVREPNFQYGIRPQAISVELRSANHNTAWATIAHAVQWKSHFYVKLNKLHDFFFFFYSFSFISYTLRGGKGDFPHELKFRPKNSKNKKFSLGGRIQIKSGVDEFPQGNANCFSHRKSEVYLKYMLFASFKLNLHQVHATGTYKLDIT